MDYHQPIKASPAGAAKPAGLDWHVRRARIDASAPGGGECRNVPHQRECEGVQVGNFTISLHRLDPRDGGSRGED
jgi:hypothetical protein